MTEKRKKSSVQNFSSAEDKAMTLNDSGAVIKNYLAETRWLAEALKEKPDFADEILRVLSITKDNSKILGFTPIYKIYKAVEDLYKSIVDEKTLFTDNLLVLLEKVSKKIFEMCDLIEKNETDELFETEIRSYLLYLDKAMAGEIFNAEHLGTKTEEKRITQKDFSHSSKEDSLVQIHLSKIAQLVNAHEEMLARSYIIMNQVELLKNALRDGDMRTVRDSYKQIASDSQNLQGSLLLSHDQLMNLIQDDAFLAQHQDFQGFFVFANGRKYLIPSEFVVDVVTESPLNYEEKQSQKFLVYIQENESGSEKNREEIPVYSLSSVLSGQPAKVKSVLDSIIIVQFQSQKIGIIVDSMHKFVSLIQKPMPPAFKNFPVLKGLAFDEKYDLIPILNIPGILKRFRAMRPYDVKKFESVIKKRASHALIVEDSETTRMIERMILEDNGFVVSEAADGIEAMTKIKEIHFDLILCDDEMPRMNGEIFLDNVRRMEKYASVPVISVSNTKIPKSDDFIAKSDFKRDELIQKIKEKM